MKRGGEQELRGGRGGGRVRGGQGHQGGRGYDVLVQGETNVLLSKRRTLMLALFGMVTQYQDLFSIYLAQYRILQ